MARSTAQGSQAESKSTPGPEEAVGLSQGHCERLQVVPGSSRSQT